ncbi:MAG: D-alanyl-D-alanine carboxypeptidase family protein [Verrucomicrobiales bacterium]|nr:D-alanyl-D-alanine carboxypeptidase family protein [Verrucomicrobiota bacterium JB025]
MHRLPSVRALAFLLSVVLLSSCGNSEPPRSAAYQQQPVSRNEQPIRTATIPPTAPPSTYAQSVIVIDIPSGRVLYTKNADQRRAVASTQKLITAMCVLDAGNLDKPVRIEKSDTDCEPTKLYLKPGEVYSRRELLKVLLVKSANDVARALARDVGGSQQGFASLMNRKCRQLGMRNSHFVNPHGLTEPGQYSTARDMAIAARAAYRSPIVRSYTSTKSFRFRYNDGRTKLLENTNKVLERLSYCTGMKTGTTNASGRCLVASGSLNGRSVIAVVLKSNTPHIWDDSTKLLRWALERPRPGV